MNYIFLYNDEQESPNRSSSPKYKRQRSSKSNPKIRKPLNPNAQMRAKENKARKAQFVQMILFVDILIINEL